MALAYRHYSKPNYERITEHWRKKFCGEEISATMSYDSYALLRVGVGIMDL